jgi:hypothetical protein
MHGQAWPARALALMGCPRQLSFVSLPWELDGAAGVIRHSGNLLFDVEENTGPGGKPRRFVLFGESVIVSPPMATVASPDRGLAGLRSGRSRLAQIG